MAKIVIFGATGQTGIPLVQQALDAGHEVVAFVRTPSKMTVQHERLTLVQGDVMNKADAEKAITPDTDAVVSVLAPTKNGPREVLSQGAENIIAAMNTAGGDRLIYMTGAGVTQPQDEPGVFDKFIKFMLKATAGDVLEHSEMAVKRVQASDLDWTVVRGPMLTNGPHSGQVRAGWLGGDVGSRLARADAADFMLREIEAREWVHKAPVVSN
jgi:putative NADH-flavin reductase